MRDIVAGNIDTSDQAFFGQWHNLVERRITHDEMLSQNVGPYDVGLQDISLANLERRMDVQLRQWWQAPQQNQQSFRDTSSVPVTPPDQDNENDNARNTENRRAPTAQRNQIRLVDVDASEKENQTEEPDRNDAKGSYHLTERSWVLARGVRNRPYQTCLSNASA
jgi:hypothetical protein